MIMSAQNIDLKSARFTIHGNYVYAEDSQGRSTLIPHDWANKFWGNSKEYMGFMYDERRRRESQRQPTNTENIPAKYKPLMEAMDRQMATYENQGRDFARSFYDQHTEFDRKDEIDFIDLSRALDKMSPTDQQKLLDSMPAPTRQLWENNKAFWQRLAQATNKEEFLEALVELEPNRDAEHRLELDMHRANKYTSNQEEALNVRSTAMLNMTKNIGGQIVSGLGNIADKMSGYFNEVISMNDTYRN